MPIIDVDRFAAEGFAKVEAVVPREVGDAARALLWERIGLSPDDPSGWRQPVVWTSDLTGEGPFGQIAWSERLGEALDLVAGPGGWLPRGSLGNMPVRFPRVAPADDRGWHIDANTPRADGSWGVSGRPHTLLLLVLLSDVGEHDAPTRVRAGSHRDVAALLGEEVLDPMAAGPLVDAASAHRPQVTATGVPGDAYLLHPFTVHAAQEHLGAEPRFMSQAPVMLAGPLAPGGPSVLSRAVA
ncbi:phytanoyl-CoA dioxygenase family protein [Nonomuraea pusilla]|uniref:Phytanoyl-CoA dioxygenase (PhyH) n=1 Tax=Nonomuraea pusilla TaxID=46177 RepID=A0A1H7IRH3_9ACTN|nr:phytanoyl-CoA dioxygenase family protein [Nonomuraea pusilla]SEK65059.1 Phytanoyl-CoA dioxygenase (PhyH) [Nonomuraea pusilla]